MKILRASWAVHRSLTRSVRRLVAATDGNHGRAVARIARERSLDALIVIPRGVSDQAVAAIAAEGAEVRRLPASYEEARRAGPIGRGRDPPGPATRRAPPVEQQL